MMTSWIPDLARGSGPLYMRLAEQIEAGIAEGTIKPGEKLPPQRNLAFDVGVTIGTVTRAYSIIRERGLVSGEVGRGTYVLDRDAASRAKPSDAAPTNTDGTRPLAAAPGKLRMDTTSAPNIGQGVIIHRLTAEITQANPDKIADYTRAWPDHWREAGRKWLSAGGWAPDTETIVPSLGVHAAIMSVIGAITAPGDKIAFEHLTYASISRSANLVGRRSVFFGSDSQRSYAEEFERHCAQQHPKLAFLMPFLHNPTLAIAPSELLADIVAIARKHNVWLIEDSIYGNLLENQRPTLASLAPERTFHVGGLSKAVSAGVRAGWVACPAHLAPRVQTAHKMMTGGLPFMLAELAARMVLDGHAQAIRTGVREEIAAREALARKAFAGLDFTSHRNAPFLWMKLAEPWSSAAFKRVAADEGVLIDDEDEYRPGRADHSLHRIRVGFSQPATRKEVSDGFSIIRRLMDHGSTGYDSFG